MNWRDWDMTAMSLRNAFPARNALRVVKQNQKMTIVTCILQLLGIPLAVFALMLELVSESRNFHVSNTELYASLGMLFLGVAVFMGMFTAIFSFTELHKKTQVDMLYALPLTGKQRFFSDYIGGCFMYIVPYVIAVILGWIITLGMSLFVRWNGLNESFSSFGGFMAEYGKLYALATGGLLVLMLLYYTLSVFVTVCCGTLFESIYTNVLLNCLIPGTAALVLAIIADEVNLSFEYMWQIIGFISPIGGLIYMIYLLATDSIGVMTTGYSFFATQTASHTTLPNYFRWMFVILLLTAVLLVIAWQLYVRRKAEAVGKPFIYIAAYYVMLTLVAVLILCLMDADAVGPALLFSAIVYFVMEVIRRRGFKRFWLSLITYAATVIVSVAGFFLITGTGCFGRVNYVPSPVGISSVVLEFDDGRDSFDYTLEYTDRDVIKAVTELHRELLQAEKNGVDDALDQKMLEERWADLNYGGDTYYNDFIPTYSTSVPWYGPAMEDWEIDYDYWMDEDFGGYEYSDYPVDTESMNDTRYAWETDPSQPVPDDIRGAYVNHRSIAITYYTRTGSMIHRDYELNADQMQTFYSIVRGTELYTEASVSGLEKRLAQDYTNYDLNPSRVPDRILFRITSEESYGAEASENSVLVKNAPETLARIEAAYRSDLAQMTAEDFVTSPVYCYISRIKVYEKCTATIAVLNELGLEGFNVAERYSIADAENGNESASSGYVGIRIYAPEQNRTASEKYLHSTADTIYFKLGEPAYEDYLYCTASGSLEKMYPEMYELLGALQSSYITEEDCYVAVVKGTSYVLPKAKSALAEAVIEKGSGYALEKDMSANEYLYGGGSLYGDGSMSGYTAGGMSE